MKKTNFFKEIDSIMVVLFVKQFRLNNKVTFSNVEQINVVMLFVSFLR